MQQTQVNLTPIIKWAGGKEKELSIIISNAPQHFENYYEPFVGGGSVFTAIPAKKHFINDKSEELINLYQCIAQENKDFFTWVGYISHSWEGMLNYASTHTDLCERYVKYRQEKLSDAKLKTIILDHLNKNCITLDKILSQAFLWHRDIYRSELQKNVVRKMMRMKKLEKEKGIMPDTDIYDNIETALMSALYMYYRRVYNDKLLMKSNTALHTALFVFIRNYAYSGMFRYNDNGDFNVPYGGIAYNHKLLCKKLEYYRSAALLNRFAKTQISNLDFEEFLTQNKPEEHDFVFLDPPYDTEFSTYAQNEFTKADQKRLANYLINHCQGKWMMVIKNTPFIYSLYNHPKLTIKTFDKKYLVSFMNRNNKNAEHLIITNY